MKELPKTLDEAENEISNEIYLHSGLFEQLEYEGRVWGNGHHIRQELAAYAAKLMKERWRTDKASQNYRDEHPEEEKEGMFAVSQDEKTQRQVRLVMAVDKLKREVNEQNPELRP